MNQVSCQCCENIINEEKIINTRKETWDSLFLFVNFQGLKAECPNMWNKNYNLLPLATSYQKTKEKLTKYCQELNQQLEQLINSFNPYFQSEIYPVLNEPHGDKTLLFRCDRLLNNKIIGESASLFMDLVIWETEYRQVIKFKELLRNMINATPWEEDDPFLKDIQALIKGRINYSVGQRFYFKWDKQIAKNYQNLKEQWQELEEYLKDWERGKGAESEWKKQLTIFQEQIEAFFQLGSENISDGKPFFQLGKVKSDTETELIMATQNRKGFSLNNPYLFVVNFHQKFFRVYVVESYRLVDPRRLYVELFLKEDWVWKDYPLMVHSLGSMESSNHPVYHRRNL